MRWSSPARRYHCWRRRIPPTRQAAVLKILSGALKKAGKNDEGKEVDAKLVKLDDALDKEFLKAAIPFKPEPFAGRKGKSDRVAVVELFTGLSARRAFRPTSPSTPP